MLNRAPTAAARIALLLLASGSLAAGQAPASPGPETPAAVEQPPTVESNEAATGRRVVGTIRGTVYAASRKPMAGLMVQLSSRGEGGVLRVTGTNERGEYVFSDLPAGVYDVEIGVDGVRRRKEGVTVRPPFRNIVDFHLPGGSAGDTPGSTGGGPVPPRGGQEAPPTSRPAPGAPSAPAADPVTVRGRFLDKDKRPVTEVSVTLIALEGEGMFQVFSSADGSFVIEAVPPGDYRVLVSSPGHVTLDLERVRVVPVRGLDLSLSLVDYPLNFKERRGDVPPREEPRAAPVAEPTGSSS